MLDCMSSSTSTRGSSIWNLLNNQYEKYADCEPITEDDHGMAYNKHPTSEGTSQGTSEMEVREENIQEHIEKITRGQRNNPLWHQYRQYRITSSTARKLLHSTDVGRPAMIKKIMNLQSVNAEENIPPAMLYGIVNEENARKRYADATGQIVHECGAFVDGVLLASPDGYIPGTDHLLEIKGLASQRNQKVIQSIKEKQSCSSYPYGLTEDEKPYLKMDNSRGYYEQVQLQMGLSGKLVVDFVIYTDIDLVYFPIKFDEAFFNELKSKLQQWHKTYIRPLLTSGKCLKLM